MDTNNIDDINWNGYVNSPRPRATLGLVSEFRMDRFFTQEGKSPFEFDIYGNPETYY